jgi:hypothetical protein
MRPQCLGGGFVALLLKQIEDMKMRFALRGVASTGRTAAAVPG